jgi:hypothetical protein
MCYTICTSKRVCGAPSAQGGFEGGVGVRNPPARGLGGSVPKIFFLCLGKHVTYLGVFSAHGFFAMVFYLRLRN